MASLQARQRAAVRTMINLNIPFDGANVDGSTVGGASSSRGSGAGSAGAAGKTGGAGVTRWSDKWKVLVYDKECRNVIAPLLSVNDLRQVGVTLHMLSQDKREPIPDVPAVYFMQATAENVERVANDCNNSLYESCYINFSSPLPRPLLERLAEVTASGGGMDNIARLMDQYLNFVSLEPCLFSLDIPMSYHAYCNPQVEDPTEVIYKFADGLFGAIVTLGVVPVIRAPTGGAAEMVARRVDERIRSSLRNSKTQVSRVQ